jgi:hypothetical protein
MTEPKRYRKSRQGPNLIFPLLFLHLIPDQLYSKSSALTYLSQFFEENGCLVDRNGNPRTQSTAMESCRRSFGGFIKKYMPDQPEGSVKKGNRPEPAWFGQTWIEALFTTLTELERDEAQAKLENIQNQREQVQNGQDSDRNVPEVNKVSEDFDQGGRLDPEYRPEWNTLNPEEDRDVQTPADSESEIDGRGTGSFFSRSLVAAVFISLLLGMLINEAIPNDKKSAIQHSLNLMRDEVGETKDIQVLRDLLNDPVYRLISDDIVEKIAELNSPNLPIVSVPNLSTIAAVFISPGKEGVLIQGSLVRPGDWVIIDDIKGYVSSIGMNRLEMKYLYDLNDFSYTIPKPTVMRVYLDYDPLVNTPEDLSGTKVIFFPGHANLEMAIKAICELEGVKYSPHTNIYGHLGGFFKGNSYYQILKQVQNLEIVVEEDTLTAAQSGPVLKISQLFSATLTIISVSEYIDRLSEQSGMMVNFDFPPDVDVHEPMVLKLGHSQDLIRELGVRIIIPIQE